jgi:hypothetical protein
LTIDAPRQGITAAGGGVSRVPAVAVTDLKARQDSSNRPDAPTRAHGWILVVSVGAQLMVVLDSKSHL